MACCGIIKLVSGKGQYSDVSNVFIAHKNKALPGLSFNCCEGWDGEVSTLPAY